MRLFYNPIPKSRQASTRRLFGFKNNVSDDPRQILEYLRNLHAITDVLSWIASRFDKAVDRVEGQQAIDDVLRELSDYLTGNIDRIDRMLLLILEKLADPKNERVKQETAELRQETIDNRVRSLRLQLAQYQNNLNWLEEQAATYGTTPPLDIKNQITLTMDKINEINGYLTALKSDVKNYHHSMAENKNNPKS